MNISKRIEETVSIKHKTGQPISINGGIFSGAHTAVFKKEAYKENISKIMLPKGLSIERAWIEHEPYHMARLPKTSPKDKTQKYIALKEAEEILWRAEHPETAFLRGLHNNAWGGNAYTVQKTADGKIKTVWVGNNNRGKELHRDKVILENLFELLTDPFEFFYDNRTGAFYFYDTWCDKPEIELSFAMHQTLLEIENSDAPLLIENAVFECSDNSMYKGKWERYLRSDWAFCDCAAVQIQNSSNICFRNCEFKDLGNTAVRIAGNCRNIRFENCHFHDSFSNGILILGDPSSTYCTSAWEENHHITYMESPEKQGAKNENYPKEIEIEECLFEWLGATDLQSAGVCVSLAHGVTIQHCTVRHMPRSGINICENAFGGHKILNNDIYDCVRETGDHGPFNSWGRDRFWSLKGFETTGKYGKLKKPYALYDMVERNEIIGNRVMGSHGFGIDLDDGSCGYTIEHNLCIGVGIKLREGFFRTVRNNVLLFAPFDYHCAFWGNDDCIENNLIYGEEPLRCVLENSGSNATFQNNYHVFKTAKDTARFKKETALSLEDILKGNYALEGLTPLSESFGKTGLEAPKLPDFGDFKKARTLKVAFYLFSEVDSAVQTATGASSREGVFLKRVSMLSKGYRKGLRTGDLLLSADGENLTLENVENAIKTAKHFTILRAQTEMNL